MGKKRSFTLENGQMDALEEMADHGDADNNAEALRRALNVGLSELGYLTATPPRDSDTRVRQIARRFGDAFAIVGVIFLGLTFWLPLEFRTLVVAPFAASLACITLDRLLKTYEPAFSRRVAALLHLRGGGDA